MYANTNVLSLSVWLLGDEGETSFGSWEPPSIPTTLARQEYLFEPRNEASVLHVCQLHNVRGGLMSDIIRF